MSVLLKSHRDEMFVVTKKNEGLFNKLVLSIHPVATNVVTGHSRTALTLNVLEFPARGGEYREKFFERPAVKKTNNKIFTL